MTSYKEKPWINTYYSIKRRTGCKSDKNYKCYGGRGIKCLISKEELKKLWFRDKAYNLKRPSIHRIDNDGDYIFSNCKYVELSENSGITRKTLSTKCPQGHPYSGKNLYLRITKKCKNRICRICQRISKRKFIAKHGIKYYREYMSNYYIKKLKPMEHRHRYDRCDSKLCLPIKRCPHRTHCICGRRKP